MNSSRSTDLKALVQIPNINNNEQNLNSFAFIWLVNKPFSKLVASVRIHELIQDRGKYPSGIINGLVLLKSINK